MRILSPLLALALLSAGCARGEQNEPGRLQVVTTVAPITNLVANVGGDAVDVSGLVPEGIDSHTFAPAPSDARKLAEADIVFANGLNLEEPTLELARANVRPGTPVVLLGDRAVPAEQHIFDRSFPRSEGDPNPHLWTNPPYAGAYAETIAAELSALDQDHAGTFRSNLVKLLDRLERLDQAIRHATETVPPDNRRLLTFHDSWPYFGREYGWIIVGAIQPSDLSDPSPREVAGIIEQIEQEGLPVVFGSEVFPSPVLEQIEQESGARYVDDLRDDDLPGEPGDPGHSLLALMVFNMETIIEATGGDASLFADVDVSNLPGAAAADYGT